METLLSIIGFLGLGALLIAAWVFVSTARRYVSGEEEHANNAALDSDLSPYRDWTPRTRADRRRSRTASRFPIIIDGSRVEEDRRQGSDRRCEGRGWVERSGRDRRRSEGRTDFPLIIGGEVIEIDRRIHGERRRSSSS